MSRRLGRGRPCRPSRGDAGTCAHSRNRRDGRGSAHACTARCHTQPPARRQFRSARSSAGSTLDRSAERVAVIVGASAARTAEAILEPALASVFGESAAREAAAHWAYGPDARLELLCVSENATYLVRDPRGRCDKEPAVLRLNRPGYHDYNALVSELTWTAALREADVVRTPRWISTTAGEPLARLPTSRDGPPRHAVLFGYARGAHPDQDGAGDPEAGLAEIGHIAAGLHAHARSWHQPAGFCRFSWDLAAALGGGGQPGRWGDWRAGMPAEGRRVVERAESRVRQALSAYGYAPSRYGLIHADLRAANLLAELNGTRASAFTVIDFDDCGYSWFLYDLAASVSFLEHRRELPELISSWLEGYRKTAAVDPADLAVVPSLVMLRRLQLQAWTSSHADTEMVRSLGTAFTGATVEVADRYLSAHLLDELS
jgi:Ser/Thr protein kinase RdoA (MazF antagonist)